MLQHPNGTEEPQLFISKYPRIFFYSRHLLILLATIKLPSLLFGTRLKLARDFSLCKKINFRVTRFKSDINI